MPKVSVILTCCNHELFVGAAIESVLQQSYTDYELLIWDDASSDGSVRVIKSFDDSRIKLFQSGKPRQVASGLNQLIAEVARGEYIAIHHSDDMWTPY